MFPACRAGGEGVAVGDGADGQLVQLGPAVPVVFVFGEGQVVVRDHLLHHIGPVPATMPSSKSLASTSMMQP